MLWRVQSKLFLLVVLAKRSDKDLVFSHPNSEQPEQAINVEGRPLLYRHPQIAIDLGRRRRATIENNKAETGGNVSHRHMGLTVVYF